MTAVLIGDTVNKETNYVVLFIMLYKETFKSVDEALSFMLYCLLCVKRDSNFLICG